MVCQILLVGEFVSALFVGAEILLGYEMMSFDMQRKVILIQENLEKSERNMMHFKNP